VGVKVGVGDPPGGVSVAVSVGVRVGVGVAVGRVSAGVGVEVGVPVSSGIVGVGVTVEVWEGVQVGVGVVVMVGVADMVGVSEGVNVRLGVGVKVWTGVRVMVGVISSGRVVQVGALVRVGRSVFVGVQVQVGEGVLVAGFVGASACAAVDIGVERVSRAGLRIVGISMIGFATNKYARMHTTPTSSMPSRNTTRIWGGVMPRTRFGGCCSLPVMVRPVRLQLEEQLSIQHSGLMDAVRRGNKPADAGEGEPGRIRFDEGSVSQTDEVQCQEGESLEE
jgi:hypothetical protein